MRVKDRLRDIAFDIASNPNPSLIRTLRIESDAAASDNNEGPQIQQDMRDLGLNVNSMSAPLYQGGAGGSTITVTYTYDPNANINENLRAAIDRESKNIANEKAQSPTIIRNHIQNLIEANPNNNDKWEISLDPSDNSQYLLEYLGKNCPEGSFSYRETNVNNEHKQVISVDKSNQIFSDLALLEKKLFKDKSDLSPEQKKAKAADKFAERYVKEISETLQNQMKDSNTSLWTVQTPITNTDALAAIQRGINKEFPGLEVTPTPGMIDGRPGTNFTFSPQSPDALNDKKFIEVACKGQQPIPLSERPSATTSPVTPSFETTLESTAAKQQMAPGAQQQTSAAPQPQTTSKAPVDYYTELLGHVNEKRNDLYQQTMEQMKKDPNLDKSDIPMETLDKPVNEQTTKKLGNLLNFMIKTETETNAAPSPGNTTSSPAASSPGSTSSSFKPPKLGL
ncbi:MAG: hypothetical protein ABSF18_03230 [Gammaproteobacteria bacterium]